MFHRAGVFSSLITTNVIFFVGVVGSKIFYLGLTSLHRVLVLFRLVAHISVTFSYVGLNYWKPCSRAYILFKFIQICEITEASGVL